MGIMFWGGRRRVWVVEKRREGRRKIEERRVKRVKIDKEEGEMNWF